MNKNISISLTGDVLLQRRLPCLSKHNGLRTISEILNAQDCRFGNLEMTVHRREGYPEMFPGGVYTMADPFCLKDLQDLGFNVYNTANNHSMDFGHGGLLATLRHLDELGIPHCGTGKNLSDASLPALVECPNGRVAIIGVTSSFHDSYAAGPQNQDIQGRPGVAPLRHKAVYELDEENFENLTRIASLTGINSYHDQARKEGFLPQEDTFKFGTFNFRKGELNRVETTPNQQDLKRTLDAVKDAKLYNDVVIVSIHSHQFKGADKFSAPDFIRIFAHECVDAGADIIVCHGPHVMRGIEVYNKAIIFHGLGNFILQYETPTVVGEEQYWSAGTTRQEATGVGGVAQLKSKGGKIGLMKDPDCWRSYFVTIDWTTEKMGATLYPIEIRTDMNNGLPSLSDNTEILEKVSLLSEEWNTHIMIENGRGKVVVNK